MRRAAIAAAVVASGSLAAADTKREVEALVRKQVETAADGFAVDAELLVKGGRVKPNEIETELLDLHGDYAAHGGGSKTTLTKLEVVVDDARGTAWFHGRATIELQVELNQAATSTPIRINGIAIKGKPWTIVAASYSEEIADADMIERAGHISPALAIPTAVVVRGDAGLAAAASGWFSGLAGGASRTDKLVANGTARDEYQTGDRATKLAASWDKLKLGAYKIEARTFGNGGIGFVRAVVGLQVTRAKRIVPMVLAAIAVPIDGGWRWVSLNWTDFTIPPRGGSVDLQ